jgi:hypothetical protein
VFRGSLPVPRSSALNTQTLIALGPECLAELLLELAGSDPAIKRRIRLAVANATSPYEAAAQVRQRLATIARSRSFLELGNNVLGRCDDSSGLLGDVFRQAMGQLGRITEAAQPDPATPTPAPERRTAAVDRSASSAQPGDPGQPPPQARAFRGDCQKLT